MADAPVWDWPYYRHTSTTSVALYASVALTAVGGGITSLNRDVWFAVPFATGHGGTITGGDVEVQAPSSATLRVALYTKMGSHDYAPGSFFADLGSVFVTAATTTWSCAAVVTSAHDLLYLCYAISSDTGMRTHFGDAILRVHGQSRLALDTRTGVLRYANPVASCWLPSFPLSATPNDPDLIRIGLRYGSIP